MPCGLLNKARQELFNRRTPEQCFITQEREDRGTLEFELHFPGCPTLRWISVRHWEGDRYWLAGSFNTIDRPLARYTRFSCVYPLAQLEREFLGWIALMLKGI
jgi:hypothetical protein